MRLWVFIKKSREFSLISQILHTLTDNYLVYKEEPTAAAAPVTVLHQCIFVRACVFDAAADVGGDLGRADSTAAAVDDDVDSDADAAAAAHQVVAREGTVS